MPFFDKLISVYLASVNGQSHFLLFQTVVINDLYSRFQFYFSQFTIAVNMDVNRLVFVQIKEKSESEYSE